MTETAIKIEPQPDYQPFRVAFTNRGQEWWYNERRQFVRDGGGPMLMSWRCPFGVAGKPLRMEGVWYWVPTATSTATSTTTLILKDCR